MPKCRVCQEKIPFLQPELTCDKCSEQKKNAFQNESEALALKNSQIENVLVSTETFGVERVVNRFGVISAECVFGLNVFKDMFSGVRDFVGGRSLSFERSFVDAKEVVIKDLKRQAYELGANTVIGASFQYGEFGGHGKSMLFIALSGTAVFVEVPDQVQS